MHQQESVKNHLSFRPVAENDRPFLLFLYRSVRDDLDVMSGKMEEAQIDVFVQQQFDLQDHHYKKYYPNAAFKVICYRKKDCGRLYINEEPDEIQILDITFDPKYRGRGFGGIIMTDIIDEAKTKNKNVNIYVKKDNRAMNLYNRLGFQITEEGPIYNQMKKYATMVG